MTDEVKESTLEDAEEALLSNSETVNRKLMGTTCQWARVYNPRVQHQESPTRMVALVPDYL